eukprot:5275417-Pleurochrysis_carterae.AAC.1
MSATGTELVKPQPPSSGGTLPLSKYELEFMSFPLAISAYNSRVIFLPSGVDAAKLKSAFAKALGIFPAAAGRVSKKDEAILLNDDGSLSLSSHSEHAAVMRAAFISCRPMSCLILQSSRTMPGPD